MQRAIALFLLAVISLPLIVAAVCEDGLFRLPGMLPSQRNVWRKNAT